MASGVPEKINFFPGSLRKFDATNDLVASTPMEDDWIRPRKIKVPWRSVFERFGTEPAMNPVIVGCIVVPKFGLRKTLVTRVSANEAREIILNEALSFDDKIRKNWLSWFQPNFPLVEATLERTLKLPIYSVDWCVDTNISSVLEEIFSSCNEL